MRFIPSTDRDGNPIDLCSFNAEDEMVLANSIMDYLSINAIHGEDYQFLRHIYYRKLSKGDGITLDEMSRINNICETYDLVFPPFDDNEEGLVNSVGHLTKDAPDSSSPYRFVIIDLWKTVWAAHPTIKTVAQEYAQPPKNLLYTGKPLETIMEEAEQNTKLERAFWSEVDKVTEVVNETDEGWTRKDVIDYVAQYMPRTVDNLD